MSNATIFPMSAPSPDKKHRKWSRSWKDTSKRAHQHRRVANFVTEIIELADWDGGNPSEVVLSTVVYA